MSITDQLHNIVKETYGTEFRIACNAEEWNLYIVRSKTIFRGTIEEVVALAIEEFLSYRVLATDRKHIKNYKKFTYK